MVFYVSIRGGLTRRLGRLAEKAPGTSVPVLLDGPYGGVQHGWYGRFDHYVVIGGGAGAGFALALAQDFLVRSTFMLAQSSKMTLVVSSRDPGLKQWFLDGLAKEIGGVEKVSTSSFQEHGLSIQIHETGDIESNVEDSDNSNAVDKEATKPSPTSNTHPTSLKGATSSISRGRPDLKSLGREITAADGASVAIAVCGPGSMVHDVGQIAASAQGNIVKGGPGASEVWFHKESFS